MKLAEWIAREGRTRKSVAETLGVTAPYITHLCADVYWPGRDLVQRIMELTGGEVGPADFIPDKPPNPSPEPTTAAE